KTLTIRAFLHDFKQLLAERTGRRDLGSRVVRVKVSELLSEWLGRSDKSIEELFADILAVAGTAVETASGQRLRRPVVRGLGEGGWGGGACRGGGGGGGRGGGGVGGGRLRPHPAHAPAGARRPRRRDGPPARPVAVDDQPPRPDRLGDGPPPGPPGTVQPPRPGRAGRRAGEKNQAPLSVSACSGADGQGGASGFDRAGGRHAL